MFKHSKKTIVFLVVAVFVLSLTACGGGTPTTGSTGGGVEESTNIDDVEQSSQTGTVEEEKPYTVEVDPVKWKGKKISVWQTFPEEGDVQSDYGGKSQKQRREEFQQISGATVEIVQVPGEDYDKKVIAAISAGTGPDIVWFGPDKKPTWMLQKLLLPLSDYIDFNDEEFMKNTGWSKSVIDFYTLNGKVYGANGVQLAARIYYNKDLFEKNGLEDPYELYLNGQWTWDKFIELAQELTQDTNGDGKIDQWGYISWITRQWYYTNGVELIKWVDGKPKFGMDDPKAERALQARYDAIHKYKYMPEVWWDPGPQDRFWKGEIAMDYWGYWEMENMKKNMGDKLGMVPFPIGPDMEPGKKSADVAECIGCGIAACSKEPDLAALWLKWSSVSDPESKEAYEKKMADLYGGLEVYQVFLEAAENAVIDEVGGYGKLGDIIGTEIENPVMDGKKTPAQAIKAAAQKAQAEIDNIWKQAEAAGQ
ncbi:ABC transporter substrate-binding protein [Mahella australiensis]|uniref:Extracellular solute-binding protein family 1 n=1 Tax=Mahella australiensis (strain DSM 15567 / CIP 107919 / 50-1 BON) TaxID=697281 RepID=F4A0S9_MAHA5|nr:extracellular solute-binding protein [Mahella australiensis]AEE96975.1 extracellular solute-binding protein family 1 [Mahella australiensis 50-1 BON]